SSDVCSSDLVEEPLIANGNLLLILLVMLRDGVLHRGDREIVSGWLGNLWNLMRDLVHHLVHVFELGQRSPPLIGTAPVQARSQPHSERLGKILVRVLLGVPAEDVSDELAAE